MLVDVDHTIRVGTAAIASANAALPGSAEFAPTASAFISFKVLLTFLQTGAKGSSDDTAVRRLPH